MAPLPITLASPYLALGDYPEEAWTETLLPNSPLRDELAAILTASAGVGVLAREGALKESSDGTDSSARQARNPLGLMVRSDAEPHILVAGGRRKLRVFPTWAAAFTEHKRRLTDPQEAYLSVGVRTLGEFIERYLMGWKPGDPNRPLPPGETHANLATYKRQFVERINARIAEYGRAGQAAPPAGGDPASRGFVQYDVPGLGTIWLPNTITVEVDLTPPGVHRPHRRVTMTGSTLHETGNRGATAGARMHSTWQDSCTPGHPNGYVGVTMYVENRLVIIKIPLDEASIHSGDWRNNAHPSMEVCVNASRNAEQTEDTAMWVQAAILHRRGQNAKDHLYPHSPSGCPAIINAQGRWTAIERGVDERIVLLKQGGGTIPPAEEYVEAIPVPREWDGLDWTREDGHVFVALRRVFVTRQATAARQSADPGSPKVRRDLPKGEAFLSDYLTRGADGNTWIVTQFGSRILADHCSPALDSFHRLGTREDQPPWFIGDVILDDRARGLDATDVPEDAPAVDKTTFMEATE